MVGRGLGFRPIGALESQRNAFMQALYLTFTFTMFLLTRRAIGHADRYSLSSNEILAP